MRGVHRTSHLTNATHTIEPNPVIWHLCSRTKTIHDMLPRLNSGIRLVGSRTHQVLSNANYILLQFFQQHFSERHKGGDSVLERNRHQNKPNIICFVCKMQTNKYIQNGHQQQQPQCNILCCFGFLMLFFFFFLEPLLWNSRTPTINKSIWILLYSFGWMILNVDFMQDRCVSTLRCRSFPPPPPHPLPPLLILFSNEMHLENLWTRMKSNVNGVQVFLLFSFFIHAYCICIVYICPTNDIIVDAIRMQQIMQIIYTNAVDFERFG